jgi:hypothetical protein
MQIERSGYSKRNKESDLDHSELIKKGSFNHGWTQKKDLIQDITTVN